MKAWSRAQYQQEREAGLYHHHRAEADLISSYLHDQQQHHHHHHHEVDESGHHHGLPYGVPIPPPLVPDEDLGHRGHGDEYPPPPPRTSSNNNPSSSRSRGKRSRHAGTGQHQEGRGGARVLEDNLGTPGDIHYPKYDVYPSSQSGQHGGKYSQQRECQYTTKYGEDCYFSSSGKYVEQGGGGQRPQAQSQDQQQSSSNRNKTWPKQRLHEEADRLYTQDDQRVQYLQDQLDAEAARILREENREPKYSSSNKKRSKQQQQQHQQHYAQRDKSPSDYPNPHYAAGREREREREYLVSTGESKHYLQQTDPHKASDPIPAIEEVGRYLEQAEARAKSVKELAKELANEKSIHTTEQRQEKQQEQPQLQLDQDILQQLPPPIESQPPLQEQKVLEESPTEQKTGPGTVAAPPAAPHMDSSMQTFRPQAQGPPSGTLGRLVDRQPEVHLQQEQIQYVDNECCQVAVTTNPTMDSATIKKTTAGSRAKTDTMKSQAHQFSTLERNMAEVAEQTRRSERELARANATLDRRSHYGNPSCDTCDAPLTPASLAGIDHRDLEHRPLTRSVTRATVYDEPPEKTSLFKGCSALYSLLLVTVCVAFLTSEIATNSVPLHYFEGLFTYMFMMSIMFLMYVFCYLLHESSCCGGPKQGTTGRNTYFQNLPRDALPDGSPVREKLATFRRPRKFKTSENEFSHGSFFLRIGGITFGLGTMIYNGLELGTFFEIPWNSPCYQVLRGINPILQMVFTFSQMYFVFMNARLNIHKFKFVARFGLMHVVATNICVWLRTLFKECTKEITRYRVDRGTGVSEDYMILEGYNTLRRKFGGDSFLVNGPYHAIMSALTPTGGIGGAYNILNLGFGGSKSETEPEGPWAPDAGQQPHPPTPQSLRHLLATTASRVINDMAMQPDQLLLPQALQQPQQQLQQPYVYSPALPGMDHTQYRSGVVIQLANNFSCGRNYIMGDIVKFAGPYLFPFVIEYSLIAAAVIFAMWKSIGKNPRYHGEDDDRMSIASRKMTSYAKTDCVGASKGLFFGLLTLVSGLICLILFFVLIDHDNQQVSRLAVFLADSSHCVILIVSILAILLGFLRVQKLKFHGEDQSFLSDVLLRVSAAGIFAYSVFNVTAGGLGLHSDPKNILVLAVGGITIIQVILQLLFITDAQRRRIHSADHDSSKPGRQVITYLLICNLIMWIIYTFEVQKVQDSPVQLKFFGFFAWTIIQRVVLPLCIFFRFYSTIILVEIWKNTYKTKLMD